MGRKIFESPNTELTSPVGTEVLYITDQLDDFFITLNKIAEFVEANITLTDSTKATKALDNLDTVAINTSLISDTDNTDDLGSSSKMWKDGFFKGNVQVGFLRIGGATGSFPGLRNTGSDLEVVGANNASFTNLKCSRIKDSDGTFITNIQQAAVADATVLLADVVTQFNTLLARLRTHGLIAT